MMSEENASQLISVDEFRKNIAEDTSLPQNIDDILLQRFLNVYQNKDIRKSLQLLKFNLVTRKNGPHIFFNRDPLSDATQTAIKTTTFLPMPKLLDDQYRVTIITLNDCDASLFDYAQVIKMAMLMFDARFTEYDNLDAQKIAAGEVFIIDAKRMSFRHFLNMVKNFSTLRIYMKYIQDAAPFNIRKIHFLNCSYIFDKTFALIKPLLNRDVMEVVQFHTQGLESLHAHISKDVLPTEFGGHVGSLLDINKIYQKFVNSKRDYLMNDDNWKILNC